MKTINNEMFSQQSCNFKFLAKEGFNTPKYYEFDTYEDYENLIISHLNTHKDLGINGFVQQTQEFEEDQPQEVFLSYDDVTTSILTEISWVTNPNGEIIPIAKFDKISIGNTQYTSCSLKNVAYIEKLITTNKMMIGDEVFVMLKDDNIPALIGVSKNNNGVAIPVPTNCPNCKSVLTVVNHKFICESEKCSVKVNDVLLNYVGLLNSKVFTEKTLMELVKQFGITSITELKSLELSQINHLKYANEIIDLLTTKATISKQQLISLTHPRNNGIAVIGHFMNSTSLEVLLNDRTVADDIIDITMVDESSRSNLVETINNQLSTIRLNSVLFDVDENNMHILTGKLFCLTNTMKKDTMKNYEQKIVDNGGRVGVVTMKLNFLVTNDNDNNKYKKVIETNTKLYNSGKTHSIIVIDEQELLKMMEK